MMGVIDISTENRLKEIAGNLKKDVKELLEESARIVTGVFRRGHCTAWSLGDAWDNFTFGISGIVNAWKDPLLSVPIVPPMDQPLVTVEKSGVEGLPAGTRMTLSEAEQRIGDLNESLWASDEPDREINLLIDYRMDNKQDRYCLPVIIGPGQRTMLEQMRTYVETSLQNPDMVCQELDAAPAGLDKLLREHFGPQFQDDLKALGDRVLGYFEQHCTISKLEQQFEKQAQAMPLKDQHHFLKSAKEAVSAMRWATNTGQDLSVSQREAPEQPAPTARIAPQEKEAGERPRQSVKVQLRQLKESQSGKSVPRKSRSGPQR